MTLLPSNEYGVRGHPGNAYDVNGLCAHPGCAKRSAHTHHLWPRSYLRGQPYEWVRLPDGTVVGNRLGFCVEHHDMLTGEIGGYRARLLLESGVFYWLDRARGDAAIRAASPPRVVIHGGDEDDAGLAFIEVGPLRFQPPAAGQEAMWAHSHGSDEEERQCPTCGHVKRRSSGGEPKPGRARPTKEWTVTVPQDAEIGADVLDGWIDDFAIVLGMDEYTSRLKRYHVLAVVLAWAGQNRDVLIADVAEAAERRVGR